MHRVYVLDRDCWTLASVYANKGPLPHEADQYVVFETTRPPSAEQICLVTPDGQRLCDIGPGHEHNP